MDKKQKGKRPVIFAVDIDGTVTENGGGRIHLGALHALRRLCEDGHLVVPVSGRSSVEGYLLSVFGGLSGVAVGENGGCITMGPQKHRMMGDKKVCVEAYELLRKSLEGVDEKDVFPRMTEVVMKRTFDLAEGQEVVRDAGLNAVLTDSGYAYHINSAGIDKSVGLHEVESMYGCGRCIAIGDSATDIPMFRAADYAVALGNSSDAARSSADICVAGPSGDGVVEAIDMLMQRSFEVPAR